MTYWGCWSDQSPRTPTNMTFSSSNNAIAMCTATCAQGGNTIAGHEYGDECYCGTVLGYEATEVVDSCCGTVCPAKPSEICGGINRLSLFSNGRPSVQQAPGSTETVNGSFFIGCYTDSTSNRALTSKSTCGNFMSLEYCARFCSGYQYFGTEYADECYCCNAFSGGSSLASSNDFNMICANNTAEFCGAGYRLSVYQNATWVPDPTTTGSNTISTPTNGGSSSQGVSCPTSNNTVVTSNGKNFTIECGVDRFGGDLTSTSVNNFQACIDACAQNGQCLDISLSGSACYLKSVLGAGQVNAGIWGARLLTAGGSTTSTTSTGGTTSPTTAGGQTTTMSTSTSSTTSQADPTPPQVNCPSANSTTYTASNGASFLIECGIDHADGGMGSKSVNSFAGCINACAATTDYVDVSLSGAACYLKSTLGAAVENGVWGAKLLAGAGTSSTSSTSSSTSTSTSSIQSLASTTPTSVLKTTSSTLSTSTPSTSTLSTRTLSTSTASSTSTPSSTSTSSTSTSTSSTSTTSAASTTLPSGFTSRGCFVDNDPSRELPNSNGTSSTQTPQQCALNCLANGYKYSGTEYASECWCGNNLPQTSAPATGCNMTCSGDSTQFCGAGNRLSVVLDNTYKQTFFAASSYSTWNLMGCYVDSTSNRLLPNAVSLAASGGASNATVGNCMDACTAKGYAYCGEEYYSECYGSNAAPPSSAVASGADPLAAGCNYPCKGNSSQACGGANRILVYSNTGTVSLK